MTTKGKATKKSKIYVISMKIYYCIPTDKAVKLFM